jgi:hypothetical protein
VIAPGGAPGYNEVTLCYDGNAASEIGAAAILTEGRCEYKMQKNKPTSSIARSGPEALRRTSNGMIRNRESEETKPLYPRNCWVFPEAGAAHPSVTRHSMPTGIGVRGTRAPASYRKKEREKGRIKENRKNKPTLPWLRFPR